MKNPSGWLVSLASNVNFLPSGVTRSRWRMASISSMLTSADRPSAWLPRSHAALNRSWSWERHSRQGPVPGRKRGRLVEEEEFRVAAGGHHRPVPAAQLKDTDDPPLACPPPLGELSGVGMEAPAAVTHPHPPLGNGDQFPEGRNAVLKWHRFPPSSAAETVCSANQPIWDCRG